YPQRRQACGLAGRAVEQVRVGYQPPDRPDARPYRAGQAARRRRRGDRMKRRKLITLLGGAAVAWPFAARGQQNRRPWRIAFPEEGAGFAGATKRFDAFRNGLRELGYTDDNSIIDRRVGNGRDELVALCQNMITHGADVIVAGSSNLALAAQEATKTVPIVIRAAADPVAAGLVASLARPGGNITGVTSQAADLSAKRLELLKQLLPQ